MKGIIWALFSGLLILCELVRGDTYPFFDVADDLATALLYEPKVLSRAKRGYSSGPIYPSSSYSSYPTNSYSSGHSNSYSNGYVSYPTNSYSNSHSSYPSNNYGNNHHGSGHHNPGYSQPKVVEHHYHHQTTNVYKGGRGRGKGRRRKNRRRNRNRNRARNLGYNNNHHHGGGYNNNNNAFKTGLALGAAAGIGKTLLLSALVNG